MRHLPSWIRVIVAFFGIYAIVEWAIDSGDKPAFMEPAVLLFLILVLLILMAIEAINSSMRSILYRSMTAEAKAQFDAKEEAPSKIVAWIKRTYQSLLGSKPVSEEHEIILDHNYDGIRELDNDLPPWWLYGFYATIIFGVVYMAKYHIFNGDSQFDEYQTSLEEARIELEEYKRTAKDLVDFNTVVVLTDAADLRAGQKIFEVNCVACHKADGGGSIGPNLTDNYWILGGGIKNVFKTISEGGRDGKGMIAWKQQLKPYEMAQVASYVLQFQGTTPADPKAPEGDLWTTDDIPASDLEIPATLEKDVIELDSTVSLQRDN